MSDSTRSGTLRGERSPRNTLSGDGQFGPAVDNISSLLTFRLCLIKGLEGEARERSLQLRRSRLRFRGDRRGADGRIEANAAVNVSVFHRSTLAFPNRALRIF
jgi:hypothetical protein